MDRFVAVQCTVAVQKYQPTFFLIIAPTVSLYVLSIYCETSLPKKDSGYFGSDVSVEIPY